MPESNSFPLAKVMNLMDEVGNLPFITRCCLVAHCNGYEPEYQVGSSNLLFMKRLAEDLVVMETLFMTSGAILPQQ